jgi:hypothetical protein
VECEYSTTELAAACLPDSTDSYPVHAKSGAWTLRGRTTKGTGILMVMNEAARTAWWESLPTGIRDEIDGYVLTPS